MVFSFKIQSNINFRNYGDLILFLNLMESTISIQVNQTKERGRIGSRTLAQLKKICGIQAIDRPRIRLIEAIPKLPINSSWLSEDNCVVSFHQHLRNHKPKVHG